MSGAKVISDEEDDYMSDAILAQCQDERPGLVPQHLARKYKKESTRKEVDKKNQTKPRKVLEAEKREEGLNKAIDSNNKGFAMLQKMGFKPGMSLGKRGLGRSEPISIEVRAGRSGLGHERETERKRSAATARYVASMQKRRRQEESMRHNFRARMSDRSSEVQAERDLYKSQKVCEHLDSQKDITEPAEPYFWPEAFMKKNDQEDEMTLPGEEDGYNQYVEEEEDDKYEEEEGKEEEGMLEVDQETDFTPSEKLEVLTLYLRNKHLYCVWCGTTFNDEEDIKTNCPGPTSADHDD